MCVYVCACACVWAQIHARGGLAAVAENTKRAIYMGLCEVGTPGAGMLYTLGGAHKYYHGWDGFAPAEKVRLIKEILQAAEKYSGFTTAARDKGHATRKGTSEGWDKALYNRLIELGQSDFELTPWAQGVHSKMLSVGPHKKEAALLKLGLLPQASWKRKMKKRRTQCATASPRPNQKDRARRSPTL